MQSQSTYTSQDHGMRLSKTLYVGEQIVELLRRLHMIILSCRLDRDKLSQAAQKTGSEGQDMRFKD